MLSTTDYKALSIGMAIGRRNSVSPTAFRPPGLLGPGLLWVDICLSQRLR
jgi:hypothetical protein